MAMTIAHFPSVRMLVGFEFEAQPSIDPTLFRDLATGRWVTSNDSIPAPNLQRGTLPQLACPFCGGPASSVAM